MYRRWCTALVALATFAVACGRASDAEAVDSTRMAVADSTSDTLPAAVRPESPPVAIDSSGLVSLELWPLAVAPEQQLGETRRIVEHLHADLALVEGFVNATLLASGDGSSLTLLATWRDDASADRGRAALTAWLYAESDTAVLSRRLRTLTPRMRVHRTVGTPPMLRENALVLVTRYALKPGHSYGALAALADSNLATRVLQDTSAQGGALLSAVDSSAICVLIQARTATALSPENRTVGPLPFWAPFAQREEQLMAVVASVGHR